jgi:hypothetical protein
LKDILGYISVLAGLLTGLLALVASYNLIKFQTERNREDTAENKQKLSNTIDELNRVITSMKVYTAEQAVINKITTTTLESLVKKVEATEITVALHSERFRFVEHK